MAMRKVLLSVFLLSNLQTSLGNGEAMVFPHASASLADTLEPASAQAMLNDLENKVMQFIKQRDGNDTSTAEGLLLELKEASQAVKDKHTAISRGMSPAPAGPDAAWDTCLLAENRSLHAWKQCKNKLETSIGVCTGECSDMIREGVGSYTIESQSQKKFSYKREGFDKPGATCNLDTLMIEGPDGLDTDVMCIGFVDDIITQASADFTAEYGEYTSEKEECTTCKGNVVTSTADCRKKKKDYEDQEEVCDVKKTNLDLKLCQFQASLERKCSTLGLVDAELTDLNDILEEKNKEFRAVMRLKCLFTRYTNNEKCFDTDADTHCKLEINGVTTTYSSRAAQELHGFRTQRDGYNTDGFECAPISITFGDNVRYVKSDPSDEYSYYVSADAQIYTTSATGVLGPTVC